MDSASSIDLLCRLSSARVSCSSRGLCGRAQVFAPLARLLGLYSLKEELEALAFRYADPGAHAEVQRRLDVLAAQQGAVVLQAQRALQAKLADDAYLRSRAAHVTVEAHQKAVYSVYRRAARRGARALHLPSLLCVRQRA